MRKALFAGLREVYGPDLDRDRRLDKLSLFVGRRVYTLASRRTDLTRGEAGRALNIMKEMREAR